MSAIPSGQRTAVRRRRLLGCRRGYPRRRITTVLHAARLRSTHLHAASLGSVGLCIGLWIRAKTVDDDERGNAERRALFVGLWPSLFWLVGDSLRDHERSSRRSALLRRATRRVRW